MYTSLTELELVVSKCNRCGLRATASKVVFGEGNPHAEIMFIGEGPGFHEDQQGRPFVGPAGQLLDKMIAACGWKRTDVYIANIVKCRPPQNRVPTISEGQACMYWLEQQIALVSPRIIIALGSTAARHLISQSISITRSRGNWFTFQGIPVMLTFHPAALLRDPSKKRPVWEDLKQVIARVKGGVVSEKSSNG
ncbi:MAG: uracil-DNA glycosylase [Firmicutes bacterium]|nr:uracil-DNA glycosylase [Bacillota bacterium]